MEALIAKYRPFLIPAVATMGLVALILFAVFFLISKTGDINAQISKESQEKEILEARLSTLRNNQAVLSELSGETAAALPGANPALQAITQVKSIASESNLLIQDTRLSAPRANEEINTVSIDLSLIGAEADVYEFIDKLGVSIPVMNVFSIDMRSQGDVFTADLSIEAHYAALPETIPSLTEPISALTADEQALLQELSEFRTSERSELPQPRFEGVSREDPFTLSQ